MARITFIDYKDDYGFWIHESAMELAARYIHKELTSKKYNFKNIDKLIQEHKDVMMGVRSSYLSFNWKRILKDEEDEKEMIRLFENIITQMKEKSTHISVEELQSFTDKGPYWEKEWTRPFATQNMIKIFNALILMLKGEWTSTNYSMNAEMDWG